MMRLKFAAAALFALTSASALAQSPPAQPATGDHDADRPKPPGDREGDWDHGDMRLHRPPPSRAASFRVEAGEISLGMRCPENEDLHACADVALQLLDKLGSLSRR